MASVACCITSIYTVGVWQMLLLAILGFRLLSLCSVLALGKEYGS
jgi:hypothetical protein